MQRLGPHVFNPMLGHGTVLCTVYRARSQASALGATEEVHATVAVGEVVEAKVYFQLPGLVVREPFDKVVALGHPTSARSVNYSVEIITIMVFNGVKRGMR